jgi:adenine-specific DNA-methyltransferase
MGFDMLILAGFAIDPEARAIIDESPLPKLQVQYASISPDVILADLLKTTRGSQLFTVFGEPDIDVNHVGDRFVVKLRGVDIYDPITGQVHQSAAKEVPAWFLDDDYDGLTFRISQAFFPKEATVRNPWDKLENALGSVVDAERMETFRGLESLPFKAGKEKKIAVKVVDVRGNEVMVIGRLNQEKG